MNYYLKNIPETIDDNLSVGDKFNAGSKARIDTETILSSIGFKRLPISTFMKDPDIKYGIVPKIKIVKHNTENWIHIVRNLQPDDIALLQVPWQTPVADSFLWYKRILREFKRSHVTSIALIHDLEFLRDINNENLKLKLKQIYEEKFALKDFDYLIVHNKSMIDAMTNCGFKREKMFSLNIFDYLAKKFEVMPERNKYPIVAIAGNMSIEKSAYIYKLNSIENVQFLLYGNNYSGNPKKDSNILYKGTVPADELPNNLLGSFGLVWDGDSTDTCSGKYGNYLRYNNPHKLSLYMAAMLPVVVWDKSAVAKFVLDNKIGITVSSLCDLHDAILSVSDSEYDAMKKNVIRISQKVRSGYFLTTAIHKIVGLAISE